jgi:hypothetical protein
MHRFIPALVLIIAATACGGLGFIAFKVELIW